jgi:hypothetical protein
MSWGVKRVMIGRFRHLAAVVCVGLAASGLSACSTRSFDPDFQPRPLSLSADDLPRYVEAAPRAECVPFAREVSGIQIYGDAYTWWDQAAGRYNRERTPVLGALLVLAGYAGPKRAHLAHVTRIVSSREIRVDHANWLNDGNLYLNSPVIDVSPNNDWSMVRVFNNRDGHLGVKNYNVQGFITPLRVAGS